MCLLPARFHSCFLSHFVQEMALTQAQSQSQLSTHEAGREEPTKPNTSAPQNWRAPVTASRPGLLLCPDSTCGGLAM